MTGYGCAILYFEKAALGILDAEIIHAETGSTIRKWNVRGIYDFDEAANKGIYWVASRIKEMQFRFRVKKNTV